MSDPFPFKPRLCGQSHESLVTVPSPVRGDDGRLGIEPRKIKSRFVCELLAGHKGACTSFDGHEGIFSERDGVLEEAMNDAYAAMNRAEEEDQWAKLALGPRYYRVDLDDIDQPPEVLAALKRFHEEDPPITTLFLLGTTDSGKTHLMHALMRRYADEMRPSRFKIVSASALLDSLRPEGGGKMRDYTEPVWLAIDDIGADRWTEWAESIWSAVADARWLHERVTLLSSNHDSAELERRIGQRAMSRFKDRSLAIRCAGPGYRRPVGAATKGGD